MSVRPQPSSETARLTHELQVHQAELESQNEELRRAQSALAAARDRYQDLYEVAPVGYLTLNEQGRVRESNRTAAQMLGQEHSALKGTYLARYLQDADAERWHHCLQQAVRSERPPRVELAFSNSPTASTWYGQIDCLKVVGPNGQVSLRVTLTDVSQRVQADLERRVAALDAEAREAERHRVALALHEDLGQRLAALKMEIATLSQFEDAAAYQTCVASVLQTLDKAVSTVRRITTDLHPPMLDDLGLNAAIEWLAQDTASRLGLRFDLSLDPDMPALDEQGALALYRFAQEALAYLLRDTSGVAFRIDLHHTNDATILVLQSRGAVDRQPGSPPMDGQAGEVLRHRARMMGGQLELELARDSVGWLGLQLTLPCSGIGVAQHSPPEGFP
jgi:two-component system sensor histidine kinase UhpB